VVADASQISLLDELDGYIKSGGQLTQFAINQGIERSGELSAIQFARPSTDQPSDLSAQGMAILADAIATRLAPQNKITELRDRINLLDELCDRKIAIPTSDVAMLAGRTASGTAIHVYGFKIVKTTRKQSRQMLWRIYRDVELSDSLPECN
jgi:hypothetical protein